MSISHLEPLLHQAERRAVLAVLRAHPEWTLERLSELLERAGPRALVLRTLTLGELRGDPGCVITIPNDDGPAIDHHLLAAAKASEGRSYDELVLQVIREAAGRAVGAKYLRARVGGPRWKLQSSLRRLVDADLVERSGTTSSTRYCINKARRS